MCCVAHDGLKNRLVLRQGPYPNSPVKKNENSDSRDKYKNHYKDANASLSAWEMTYTLRSFPPRYGSRLWFDHPIHRPDELNILGGAKYKNGSNRGKGTDQTAKEERERSIEEAFENLSFGGNCVSREDLIQETGLSENRLKDFIGPTTRWEPATLVTGDRVVIRRNAASITFKGTQFFRPRRSNAKWLTEIIG